MATRPSHLGRGSRAPVDHGALEQAFSLNSEDYMDTPILCLTPRFMKRLSRVTLYHLPSQFKWYPFAFVLDHLRAPAHDTDNISAPCARRLCSARVRTHSFTRLLTRGPTDCHYCHGFRFEHLREEAGFLLQKHLHSMSQGFRVLGFQGLCTHPMQIIVSCVAGSCILH